MSGVQFVVDTEPALSMDDWIKLERPGGPRYEEDSVVFNCRKCQVKFNNIWWPRRHHCRYCGKIFCHDCSDNFRVISPHLDLKKVRVCNTCAKLLDLQSGEYTYWSIFLWLDLKTIKTKCLRVCKFWNSLGQKYLDKMANIQYLQPSELLSRDDESLLQVNRYYLTGHRVWIFQLFRVTQDVLLLSDRQQRVSCETLKCSQTCESSLSTSDYLHLILYTEMEDPAMKICCDNFDHIATDIELQCFIYLLVGKFINLSTLAHPDEHSADILLHLLLNISKRNQTLAYLIYWEALFTDSQLLVSAMEQEFKTLLIGVRKTFYGLSFPKEKNVVLEMTNLLEKNHNISLIADGGLIVFNAIEKSRVETMKSKSRPTVIPLLTTTGSVHKYLFKQGDLIKDFIVCQIIDLMVFYINRETNIKIDHIGYRVFLLKNNCGLIEMIKDAKTIYQIRTSKMSILNYILDNNKRQYVEDIRGKFIDSLALSLVITHLLGVGDRHMDNIMVHKSGYLFHIDFEYILGDDPKVYNNTVLITYDMLDTIGGQTSENYEEFKKKCSIIFNCLRKHTNVFITMLTVLNDYSNSKIVEIITQRFEPGEKYLDGETYIKTLIDSSHATVTTGIMDSIYRFTRIFH